jgi:hypothetical protein
MDERLPQGRLWAWELVLLSLLTAALLSGALVYAWRLFVERRRERAWREILARDEERAELLEARARRAEADLIVAKLLAGLSDEANGGTEQPNGR